MLMLVGLIWLLTFVRQRQRSQWIHGNGTHSVSNSRQVGARRRVFVYIVKDPLNFPVLVGTFLTMRKQTWSIILPHWMKRRRGNM